MRNPGLDSEKIALASQSVLEEILFLRIFEARSGCGSYWTQSLLDADGVYHRLCEILSRSDELCGQSNQDCKSNLSSKSNPCEREYFGLMPGLAVDDGPLKKVIGQICRQVSYDLSLIPINILGRVYEHLLGSEIYLLGGGKAEDGSRANARKAGGIYYTPDYIIDYIVESALGRLLEGKNPVQAVEIKILDPACGCGSFLIRALQYLLDWHLSWYLEIMALENLAAGSEESNECCSGKEDGENIPGNIRSEDLPITRSRDGSWKLTISEKRSILKNSIFGVDIDLHAVELTKRSLKLMLIERSDLGSGCNDKEMPALLEASDLCSNIKCGNALIGHGFSNACDYPDGEALQETGQENCQESGQETLLEASAFNWAIEFPHIAKSGGFDAVIGNPPYVRQEVLCRSEGLKDCLREHYQVYHGGADLYSYFIERGISHLRSGGILSYVTANKWLRARYGLPLRRWMRALNIVEVIDFGDLPAFKKASAYPCILTISKEPPGTSFRAASLRCLDPACDHPASLIEHIGVGIHEVDRRYLNDNGWSLTDEPTQALLSKIRSKGVPLGSYLEGKIHRGVLTGLNKAFVIDRSARDRLIQEDPRSLEMIKPVVSGRDIKRYCHLEAEKIEKFLIFARHGTDIDEFPAIKRYLAKFREDLEPRAEGTYANNSKGRKPGDYRWHEIQDPIGYCAQFEVPKILLPDISLRGNFALDYEGKCYCLNNAYIISSSDCYLLAILNSVLITFFYREFCSTCRGGYLRFTLQYLVQLPIYSPSPSDTGEKTRCIRLENLAREMLELHRRLARTNSSQESAEIHDLIKTADRQIDDLVYELYCLTEEEVELVERTAGRKDNSLNNFGRN